MPWCPRCRTEYMAGVIICSECGAELVEELPNSDGMKVIMIANLEEAKRYYDLLKSFDMTDAKLVRKRGTELYHVIVPEEKVEKAKKLAMIQKINLKTIQEEPEEEPINLLDSQNHVYVHHSEKHSELLSSGYSLLIAGGLGLVFVLLCQLHVIRLPIEPFSRLVMEIVLAVLSLVFIGAGFYCLASAKSIKKLATKEDKLTSDITYWFKKSFDTYVIDTDIDEKLSEEIKYFKRCEAMKRIIKQTYGELNEGYLDRLIDELYQYLYEDCELN